MKKLLLLTILFIIGCNNSTEPTDCDGVEGGNAVEDNCGTCDSDSTNDCTADCNGVWGGTYSINECDYCLPEYASNYNCDDLNVIDVFKSQSSITENVIIDIGNQIWSEVNGRLISLDLRRLEISGTIPQSISDITYLEKLLLSHNGFSGSIPTKIGDLSNLKVIALGNNQLTGEIPTSFYNLSNLEELWLWGNQLSGQISNDIGNFNKLDVLDISENQFSGAIPESICELYLIIWSPVWDGVFTNRGFLYDNNFCPEYPSCVKEYVGEQDTSECEYCIENPTDPLCN